MRERINEQLMLARRDPDRPGEHLYRGRGAGRAGYGDLPQYLSAGQTVIGERCVIGPNTHRARHAHRRRCRVLASVLEEAILEDDVHIGPFGHLRPGAHLGKSVHMGNFGEVKNSYLAPGVKMGHFSYVGDAEVGADVNIGAGTITCNYDGEHKHRTTIGEGAFIGSGTMLVAPVRCGRGRQDRRRLGGYARRARCALAYGVPARVQRAGERGGRDEDEQR